MTMNNRIGWLCAVAVVLSGSSAWAIDPGACLIQSTSRLDSLLSPVKGSDEKFFTSGGGPPNVMLVLDTSCSMADWPQTWPSSKGCAHAQIVGLGYDPSANYPGMVDSISGSTITYNPNWFDVTKYYEAPAQGYGTDFAGTPRSTTWTTSAAACSSGGISGADSTACQTCLSTQGYYVYSNSVRRVTGNFINFYAPRDSGATMVLTQVAAALPGTRMGLEAFTVDGNTRCWGGSNKLCLVNEMGPSCTDSFPINAAAVETHRNGILDSLKNNLNFGSNTPLASSLYAAMHYMKNHTGGTDPFLTAFGAGYPTDSDFNEESITVGNKSICASCGYNAIIVVTDGEPNSEVVSLPTAIRNEVVTCVGGSCISLDMAKVAKWGWENDLRSDYGDVQKVATYTIGFSQDANASGTLKTAAQYGGGKFYPATNTAALKSAVFAILDEVNSKNTSFSAAAIASVQSAGSTFAAILPRFSPQPNQPWVGTLQRFNLFNEFVEDINLNPGEVDPIDGGVDADKTDIWLVDSTMPAPPYPPAVPVASARVLEDANGKFVRWGTATPATPYWEAGGKLVDAGYAVRKIYTVRDSDGDGAFTSADTAGATHAPLAFTSANAALLADYLGIRGTSFCPSFAGTLTCVGGTNNGGACATVANCPSAYACNGGSHNSLPCALLADGGTNDCPAGALACSGGPNDGNTCTTAGNNDPACGYYHCSGSSHKCSSGPNKNSACTMDSQCKTYPCGGTCIGGPNDTQPCTVLADCAANVCVGGNDNGKTCAGAGDCDGSCSGGSSSGNNCNVATDCRGTCNGGSRNGRSCNNNGDCNGGGSCNRTGITCVGGGNCVGTGTCSTSAAPALCAPLATSCVLSGAGASGDMLTKFGLTVAAAAGELGIAVPVDQPTMDDLCVKVLIEYIRGRDLGDEDADGDLAETRPSVLGDIFHSSPAIVDPPVERFLCDVGISNQCVRTLYSSELGPTTATPNDPPTAGSQVDCASAPVTRDAYDAYQYMNRRRDKMVLVGANDGMLHAFHDGNATLGACALGLQPVDYLANDGTTDPGSEVWAFIPPDLLPRLQEYVFGHAYYVDGDIMVRDVWEDANKDGRKTWNEFHTLAVIADGRGGTHYTALELRYTNSAAAAAGLPVNDLTVSDTAYNIAAPGFRWIYPQPGSDEAAFFGKTLLSLSPKPPPIGPVLIERATIPAGDRPSAGTNRYTCSGGSTPCDTTEKWMVMLGGGWTPSSENGRGVYMVDAWNGKVNGRNDNLWWKATYQPGATGEQTQALREMRYSITAPVAMVDYGSNNRAQLDGFFDTAVVGDLGGQVWLARFFKPGRVNSGTLLVDDWAISRTFEMDRLGDPNANGDNRTVLNVWPFYYLFSAGVQPDNDALRVFSGTGNRYALLEPQAGICRYDDPLACAKYQCSDTKSIYKIQKNTVTNTLTVNPAEMHWTSNNFRGPDAFQTTTSAAPPAGSPCGTASTTMVTASVLQSVNGCPPQSGSAKSFGDIRDTAVSCGQDASGNFFCKRTDINNANVSDLTFTPQTAVVSALTNNRFFGFWAYGGPDATRKFEEDLTTTATAPSKTATDFDGTRLSDRTTGNATYGDLIDVTASTCTTVNACTGNQAKPTDKGWFYNYSTLENRTASGPAVLASCVLWNSIYPASAATTCGVAAVANGRFHQANYLTGLPNCAAGFKDSAGNFVRAMDRGVQAPPAEPATAIQISKTGQIRYSALLVEPGAKQATEANVTTGNDVLQQVYEIPVSRGLHGCRHTPGGSTNCVEAPP